MPVAAHRDAPAAPPGLAAGLGAATVLPVTALSLPVLWRLTRPASGVTTVEPGLSGSVGRRSLR
ncbi:hypothetical protein [Micromonospora halophytica]|uniref:hypothetical protein n=1 Tax=Micromonospora halophytica TaxID=47864 RepID=UPI0011130032|nr:hypothetical protein [Micromonospora halophytica]